MKELRETLAKLAGQVNSQFGEESGLAHLLKSFEYVMEEQIAMAAPADLTD